MGISSSREIVWPIGQLSCYRLLEDEDQLSKSEPTDKEKKWRGEEEGKVMEDKGKARREARNIHRDGGFDGE